MDIQELQKSLHFGIEEVYNPKTPNIIEFYILHVGTRIDALALYELLDEEGFAVQKPCAVMREVIWYGHLKKEYYCIHLSDDICNECIKDAINRYPTETVEKIRDIYYRGSISSKELLQVLRDMPKT